VNALKKLASTKKKTNYFQHHSMKAIVQSSYGGPEVYSLMDVPKPEPKANEVRIKVIATAINDYDWSLMRGKPFIYRLMFGFLKPKSKIPGMELSGTVDALGENVVHYKIGDAVYGDTSDFGFGTFAEYFCIHEKAITLKPSAMSFEEATTVPHASMLAYQGLVEMGKIKEGQKVLINGAGGGVGTFALAISKLYNVHITGVDTGAKLFKMKEIGFNEVIDYKKVDFTQNGIFYDLILDAKTTRGPKSYLRSLSKNGCYVTVGGHLNKLMYILLLKPFLSIFSKKSLKILPLKPNKDLAYINKLYEDDKLIFNIDGPYPLSQTPEMISYFGEGKHIGKVVIRID